MLWTSNRTHFLQVRIHQLVWEWKYWPQALFLAVVIIESLLDLGASYYFERTKNILFLKKSEPLYWWKLGKCFYVSFIINVPTPAAFRLTSSEEASQLWDVFCDEQCSQMDSSWSVRNSISLKLIIAELNINLSINHSSPSYSPYLS